MTDPTPRETSPREIQVKLLLSGGHEHSLYLPENSPTLQQLFSALINQSQTNTPSQGLFQIPLHNQRSLLALPSQHLIGIITEPPISVQLTPPTPAPTAQPPLQTATPSTPHIPYIQISDFLDRKSHEELLNYALSSEAEFVETGPVTNTEQYKDYRNSRVIFYPKKVDRILHQIKNTIPTIITKLGIPPFTVSDIEVQLTAHNDNNYYKVHNDNGSPQTASRKLTYVYYFYQEPKAFSGGELEIYPTPNAHEITPTTPKQTIQPDNNSIIFFPSQLMHEVLPVQCPTKAFTDSRFTINGWVRG